MDKKEKMPEPGLPLKVDTLKTLVYSVTAQKMVTMVQLIREIHPSATSVLGYAPFLAGKPPPSLAPAKEWQLTLPDANLHAALCKLAAHASALVAASSTYVGPGWTFDEKNKSILPSRYVIVNMRQFSLKASQTVQLVQLAA